MLGDLELVLDAKATLGEAPCWDSEKQLLYWVDILEKKVCIFNPVTKVNREILLNQNVSAIVPRNAEEVVLTLENGFYLLNLETEILSNLHELEGHLPNNRFNDGKCDAKGRFWAGTMDKFYAKEKGGLYCLDTDITVKRKLGSVSISNGLTWSFDNQFMYFIDTLTKKVVQYNFNIHSGEIDTPTEVINFSGVEGLPDGMTIDEEGMLWIAHWGGSKVSRWDPKKGNQLMEIIIPAINVTSCTFGGEDLSELYITTARTGLAAKHLRQYPFSGGVFKIKTGVKGSPSYSFKG